MSSMKYTGNIHFKPLKYVIPLLVLLVIYIGAAIGTYIYQDSRLTGSTELAFWIANYSKKCKNFKIESALHNSSLIGCGYIVFSVFSYVFTLYRTKISSYMNIEDYHTYN